MDFDAIKRPNYKCITSHEVSLIQLLCFKESPMQEVIDAVSNAISLTKRLREISENIKEAEFRNIVADLSIELAEAKMKVADLISENVDLRKQLSEIETPVGDICPSCRKYTYVVVKSEPDKTFGDLGGLRRTYQCSSCGFREEKIET